MPIYKRCSRCRTRLPSDKQCDCSKKRYKEYDKFYRDKKSNEFYHSKEWELTRLRVLAMDKGLDVYAYMTNGETMFADAVHHIIPLKEDWNRRCDIYNLISLSTENHSIIEKMYENDKENTQKLLFSMVKEFRKIFE